MDRRYRAGPLRWPAGTGGPFTLARRYRAGQGGPRAGRLRWENRPARYRRAGGPRAGQLRVMRKKSQGEILGSFLRAMEAGGVHGGAVVAPVPLVTIDECEGVIVMRGQRIGPPWPTGSLRGSLLARRGTGGRAGGRAGRWRAGPPWPAGTGGPREKILSARRYRAGRLRRAELECGEIWKFLWDIHASFR
jgi:hypothetical protein